MIDGGVDSNVVIAILIVFVILLVAAAAVGWTYYGNLATSTDSKTCTLGCNPATSYLNPTTCECVCFPGYVKNGDMCVNKTCASGFTWSSAVEMCIPTVVSNPLPTNPAEPVKPTCPNGQVPIMKDDGSILCATTTKACDGYFINGQCIKKNCSNVKCANGGTVDDDCICKCSKGFSGRDCSIVGCIGPDGTPSTRCYNGSYDSTTCRCKCDDGFGGNECNIYSGISTKKDCDKKEKGIWTGQECITTRGDSPFPRIGVPRKSASDLTCYENVSDEYYYIHDKSATDPWQCYLGDNVKGIIGDDTSYLYGQRCIGGSKQECLDLIAKLV
jgi:hypothetical protein